MLVPCKAYLLSTSILYNRKTKKPITHFERIIINLCYISRFESSHRLKNPEMHLQNFKKLQSRKKHLGEPRCRRNLSISPFLLIFFCSIDGGDQNSFHFNTSIQNGFIVIISTLDQKFKPILVSEHSFKAICNFATKSAFP